MLNKKMAIALARSCLAMCLATPLYCMAGYTAGTHHWDVKNGKLIMMSGLMTDNAAEAYFNYTFFLEGDKTLYQVPIVKGESTTKFDLSTLSSGDGEVSSQDVKIVASGGAAWLLIGSIDTASGRTQYESGPVSVRVYQLVEGNDGDWAWYFKPVTVDRYKAQGHYTVERAIAESAARVSKGK